MVDDWGCLKGFHGMDIYCPSTIACAMTLVGRVLSNVRPAYIRIPKGEYNGNDIQDDFSMVSCGNRETLVVTYGELAELCRDAAPTNTQFSLMVMNRLHPLTDDSLRDIIRSFKMVIVIEDHFKETGLYSSLAEKFAFWNIMDVKLRSISPKSYRFDVKKSARDYLLELCSQLPNVMNSIEIHETKNGV
jgi:deoxyxylulose-5-phosphate synthase